MTRKYAKRKIKYWQLNKKEVDQLTEINDRRINEILDKILKDLLEVNIWKELHKLYKEKKIANKIQKNVISEEEEGELDLAWILPCSACRHFNMNCRWYKDCVEAVNTGRGLKYFEEKK